MSHRALLIYMSTPTPAQERETPTRVITASTPTDSPFATGSQQSSMRAVQDGEASKISSNGLSIVRTRGCLAFLNIVGAGMRGPLYENNNDDMDGRATAAMLMKYPNVLVGIKSAHYSGHGWKPFEQAVIAGNIANRPIMIDFGANGTERPLLTLLSQILRPGDIYTHMYSGLRGEQDSQTLGPSQAMLIGRKRGIYFRCGPRRRQFQLVGRCAAYEGRLRARFHLDGSAHHQHECRNEGHPECC